MLKTAISGHVVDKFSTVIESCDKCRVNEELPKGPKLRKSKLQKFLKLGDSLASFGLSMRKAELAKTYIEKSVLSLKNTGTSISCVNAKQKVKSRQ